MLNWSSVCTMRAREMCLQNTYLLRQVRYAEPEPDIEIEISDEPAWSLVPVATEQEDRFAPMAVTVIGGDEVQARLSPDTPQFPST